MAEREEGKAGILPKELVNVECPRCGFKISEDSEVRRALKTRCCGWSSP